jgi:hypothetical protein
VIEQNLDALRLDAAKRGKWNIGFFAAGLTFWLYATVVGLTLDLETARVYWLVGTFFIFPAAVLFSWLFGADPFTKGNILGALVGYTHMSVIALTLPLVVAAFVYFPQIMLLTMAIAYCVDFYVMTWAFGTRLFGIHAALRTLVVSIIWFALPDLRASALPASVAVFYLATLIISPILRHRWLAERQT